LNKDQNYLEERIKELEKKINSKEESQTYVCGVNNLINKHILSNYR